MEKDCIYYKYVPHHQQREWEAAGWVFDQDLGPPHAAYASLYRWGMDGEPVIPDNINIAIVRESTEIKDGEE
jgi:hypothetical protein